VSEDIFCFLKANGIARFGGLNFVFLNSLGSVKLVLSLMLYNSYFVQTWFLHMTLHQAAVIIDSMITTQLNPLSFFN